MNEAARKDVWCTFEAVIIFVSTVTTATVPSADAEAKCPTHRERPKL